MFGKRDGGGVVEDVSVGKAADHLIGYLGDINCSLGEQAVIVSPDITTAMRRWFTLLELSMVLVVSVLMLSFALQVTQSTNSKGCYVSAKTQVESIRELIERFARSNDRLPMPAASNVGVESANYGPMPPLAVSTQLAIQAIIHRRSHCPPVRQATLKSTMAASPSPANLPPWHLCHHTQYSSAIAQRDGMFSRHLERFIVEY